MATFPVNRLRDDESGGLTPVLLVMFTGIVLMTGIALDLMRHESERSDLQDALDRGVLAAASVTQTVDPELTVAEYLANRALSQVEVTPAVIDDIQLNSRRIDASAQYGMPTVFLRMAGLTELPVAVGAAALQRLQDVEISLVMDISGSMAREISGTSGQSRLQVLRDAASHFIDVVLTDTARDRTTISLVPFSGQVNAGPLFNHLNTSRVHNYSSCVEFVNSDFNTTALPAADSRAQVPHFQWFTFEGAAGHEAQWGWCPNDAQPILPFSNDPDTLKARINGLIGFDGTGTQIGMKWGLGLLAPTTQPLTEQMVATGLVRPEFAERPAAFGNPDVLKVVVLMTDGNIRYQQRPKASAYDTASERAYWAANRLTSSNAVLSTSSAQNSDEAFRRTQFLSLCQLAKDNDVLVFTIGFDVPAGSAAYQDMRSCASSAGHFYHVEGLELVTAFEQIASTIEKLKLVK